MATPNSDKAASVGQDKTYKDVTDAYDASRGKYDGSRSDGGKPTQAGPGPLPNTPNPFTLTGG